MKNIPLPDTLRHNILRSMLPSHVTGWKGLQWVQCLTIDLVCSQKWQIHFVKRKHFDDTENDDHGHQGRLHSNREAERGS